MGTSRQGIPHIVIYPTIAHKPKFQLNSFLKASSYQRRINTGVYVDSDREVQEVSTRNNKLYREIQVTKYQVCGNYLID
jgi:hypothetical protein